MHRGEALVEMKASQAVERDLAGEEGILLANHLKSRRLDLRDRFLGWQLLLLFLLQYALEVGRTCGRGEDGKMQRVGRVNVKRFDRRAAALMLQRLAVARRSR